MTFPDSWTRPIERTWTIDGWVPDSRSNRSTGWNKNQVSKKILIANWAKDKSTRQRVAAVVGKPPGDIGYRCRLVVTMYRVKLLDPTNVAVACKALVDAINRQGWLVDDNATWLDFEARQVKVRRADIRTTITWSPA